MGPDERKAARVIGSEAQRIIREFPLGTLATVGPDGAPAASPKGTFLVLDDSTLAYGDIRSPGSRANLEGDGRCEVVFVDVFRRKGVRVRGLAAVHPAGSAEFDRLIGRWREVWGELAGRITSLVVISADRVLLLTTPPYDTGATEEEMIAMYRARYAALYPEAGS